MFVIGRVERDEEEKKKDPIVTEINMCVSIEPGLSSGCTTIFFFLLYLQVPATEGRFIQILYTEREYIVGSLR